MGEQVCSFLLGIYLELGFLGHSLYVYWALVDTAKQLFKIVDAVNTPTGNV